jgi:hypothetical protein
MAKEKETFVPQKPAYRGKMGIAVWENKDKYGKTYLSMKLFGETINLFPVKE